MKLEDILPQYSTSLTREEKLELIQTIRSQKTLTKPATAKRKQKAQRSKFDQLTKGMDPETIKKLLEDAL